VTGAPDERRREQELRNERLEQQVAEQQRMIQKLKQNQSVPTTSCFRLPSQTNAGRLYFLNKSMNTCLHFFD